MDTVSLEKWYLHGLRRIDACNDEDLRELKTALKNMGPYIDWHPNEDHLCPLLTACIEMNWVEGMQACLDRGASIEIALSNFRTIDKGLMNPRAIGALLQQGWVPNRTDIVTWAFVHPLRDLLALTEHGLDLTVKDDQGWQTVDYVMQHDMAVVGHSPHLASTNGDRVNYYLYVCQQNEDMNTYIPRHERPERQAWVEALQEAQSMIDRKALNSAVATTIVPPSKPKVM